MTETTGNMRRITKNTMMLFVRILVLTIVNLYAVRILLKGLGNSDYGIFYAVSGVVMMSSCLLPVFSQAIQRFYSYLAGTGEEQKLQDVFSVSLNIIFLICLGLAVIFETLGVWFLNTQMTIPTDRLQAANIAFQFSMLSFMLTLLQIPYTAAIFAHEDINIYTKVSCLDCFMKLTAAFLVGISQYDNISIYSFCLTLTAATIFAFYAIYSKRNYKECKYKIVTDKNLYKMLLSFTGWSTLGSLAGVGLIQGSAILLNIFFGPIINAAFAIALNVYNAMLSLGNCIILAFRAQMIKSYAAGNNKTHNALFSVSSISILYLLAIVAIPLYVEIEKVLQLWLGNVTAETIPFVRLILIYTICLSLSSPITTTIQATGKIKYYYIFCDSMTLMHLPIAFIILWLGMPAESVLLSMIGITATAHVVRIIILKRYYKPFDANKYIMGLLLRGCVIIMASTFVTFELHKLLGDSYKAMIALFILSPFITLFLYFVFGTNRYEQQRIISITKKITGR